MSNYFNELISSDSSLITNEVITEAAYPENLEYNKILQRQFFLPKGNPVGKGVMCYVYTDTVDGTIRQIMKPENFLGNGKYHLYYYYRYYRGKLYATRYRYNDTQLRKDIYEKIKQETNLRPVKEIPKSSSGAMNIYMDISKWMYIFNRYTGKLQSRRLVSLYWGYLKQIFDLTRAEATMYHTEVVLCDLSQFPIGKDLLENLKNPLYMIYYTLLRKNGIEEMKKINIDFYFYVGRLALKINPATLTEESVPWIRALMNKMMRSASSIKDLTNATDEILIAKEEIKGEEKEAILTKVAPVEGIEVDGKEVNVIPAQNVTISKSNVEKQIDSTVDKVADKLPKDIKASDDTSAPKDDLPVDVDDVQKELHKQAKEELNKDRELIEQIYRQTLKQDVSKSQASTARDQKLREEQKNLKVKNATIEDIEKVDPGKTTIPVQDISRTLTTTNENMKTVRFNNFEKEYNKKLMQKDLVDSILALNDKSIPMYVLSIDVQDSSDELNYKDTYTIKLEDANRKRHTIKVDIPKFIEDRFLFIGGNKKRIKYQNFYYPIVKIKEDKVLVVSNYNKMTIQRVESRSLSYVERIKRLIASNPELQERFTSGNVSINNRNYITTLEYDELSKSIISYKHGKDAVYFNQVDAEAYRQKNKIEKPDNTMFIGVLGGNPIFIDIDTQRTADDKTILDVLIPALGGDYAEQFGKIRPIKRLLYTKATVMAKDVSVGLLLGLWEGITSVMKKLKLKYRLEDKVPTDLTPHESFIRFNDCVLVYEETVPAALIMNGFRLVETSQYSILDFDKSDPYLHYIIKVYGKAQIENALNNVYEFMIDPITKSILKDLNQPTDIVSVVIYAVSLLADSQYITDINQGLNRIRSNEIVAAILYNALASGYVKYRNSNGRQKFSIKQDAVITELISQKTVEDYSTLNPVVELQQVSAISTKGYKGINLDESYTVPRRSYDSSMIGTIAPGTSPDGGCGVARYLTMEPSVTNLRGYVNTPSDGDINKLTDVNLFSPSELTVPLAVTHDDPNRLGHTLKQNSHVVPVEKASPVLISNGIEERARFMLSSDFVINAEEPGEIIDYDEELQIMIAKYKSGKCRAINLAPVMAKNGGGGFWLSNQLTTELKVGDKFKKDDVLAYHKKFFTNSRYNHAAMNMGTLVKCAVMSSYNTYEDAAVITKKLSEDASTEMVFLKSAVIGKNANVTYIAHKGDEIEVGDMLAQFDTSYEDESVNQLLAVLGDEDRADILAQSKNEIKSKYSGIIEDIKVYSTVDLDELSPSLKKIVSAYYRQINKKKEFLNKYDPENAGSIVKCGIIMTETTKKIEPNKYGVVKGEQAADSVLIEFYIKHKEPLEIGSKVAQFGAIKNTIGEIIPEGYEPFSEYHPDEEIGTLVAPNSLLNRMVWSLNLNVLGNKCIVELKRHLKELYDE